jgi:hypothetical protein
LKNPRDTSKVGSLTRQVDTVKWRYIFDAYQQATEQSHGYLLFDLRQDIPQTPRLRTRITPEESETGKLQPIISEPMSRNLRKCFKEFECVAKIENTREREAALKSLSVEERYFKALHEMTINTLNGNIPLKYFQKQGLKRHKSLIKTLVCAKRRSRNDKAKTFTQSGG